MTETHQAAVPALRVAPRTTRWEVWTGEVGGFVSWQRLRPLSRTAQELYAVLLEVSEPMPRVIPLPRRANAYWGRRAQVSMTRLGRLVGVKPASLYAARRELESVELVAVVTRGGFDPEGGGRVNVYAIACGWGATADTC